MEPMTRKELLEIDRIAKLAQIKEAANRLKELDKSKAYDLLMKLSTQYSSSEVVAITNKKLVG